MKKLTELLRDLERYPSRFNQTERKALLDTAIAAIEINPEKSDMKEAADAEPVAQIVGDDKTRRLIWRCNAFDYDVGTELYALDKDSK